MPFFMLLLLPNHLFILHFLLVDSRYKMLCYHESELDEFNLDKKPLLGDLRLDSLCRNEIRPIYVNECYIKNSNKLTDYMVNTQEASKIGVIMDENDNEVIYEANEEFNLCGKLCGLFIAAFDTKLGNIIEWQIPSNLDLEHVEFKAMASGFHLMESDLV